MPDAIELGLVPTDDLIMALLARFENVVFMGTMPHDRKPHLMIYKKDWHGDRMLCLGLASRMAYEIQQNLDEVDGPLDDDSEQHG